MMSHAAADDLLQRWAAAELAEIRRLWYPPATPGYAHWEAPRGPEERLERQVSRAVSQSTGEALVYRTGWCLINLRAVHRRALRRYYLDGVRVGAGARRAALSAFAVQWEAWAEALDGPLSAQ